MVNSLSKAMQSKIRTQSRERMILSMNNIEQAQGV